MLRIAVFATIPKGVFSGGRFHAMMIAQVLARRGHEAYFVSDNPPVFAGDLAPIAGANPVRLVQTAGFEVAPARPFDAVFVTPQMSIFPNLYRNAVRFARESGAALVLINFESPNWFNAFSPVKRPEAKWVEWKSLAAEGALVLSSAWESERYAREFYTDLPPESAFDVWQPAINSVACDAVPARERDGSIVLFSRPTDAHKGGGDIGDLIGPELAGHTIALVIGNPMGSERFIEDLRARGRLHGVKVEPFFGLSETQKYALLKRASAVVFPSYFEGYGYPPIEALATDTPCVAYDLPVLRETCGDLVRFAPLGDVAALRRELVKALAIGPTGTDRRPEVIELTSVDARGAALEGVIGRYRAHLRRVRSLPTRFGPGDLVTHPASVVELAPHPLVVIALSTPRRFDTVSIADDAVVAVEILDGVREGRGWRQEIVLTLRDRAALDRLRSLRLVLGSSGGDVALSLAETAISSERIPWFPDRCARLDKVFRRGRTVILSGWLRPHRPYDGLILLDAGGRAVRLTTGLENLDYRKVYRREPDALCDFSSPMLDVDRFDMRTMRLLAVRDGQVVGRARLDPTAAVARLPLLAEATPGDAPIAVAGRAPGAGSIDGTREDAVETVGPAIEMTAVCRTSAEPAITATTIRKVSMRHFLKHRAIGIARRWAAKARSVTAMAIGSVGLGGQRSAGSSATPLVDGVELRWALDTCRLDEDGGELVVRGWTDLPDKLRVEILDGNGRLMGVAGNGDVREDVAEMLGRRDRTDFGFLYRQPFDGNPGHPMKIRLMYGLRVVTEKLLGTSNIGRSFKLKVDDHVFDPQWSVLWMRGTFESAVSDLTELTIARDDRVLATAALDPKFRPNGKIFYRWRVEEVVEDPPQPGEVLTLRATCADGTVRRIVYEVPPDGAWAATVAGRDAMLETAEGSPEAEEPVPAIDLVPLGAEPMADAERRVLLVIHNLNAIERPEKREALLRLRRALNARGRELILLHHSKQPAGCAIPEINFHAEQLNDAPEPSRTIDPATRNYAQRMAYGFTHALNRRPKPWAEIEAQTGDELARVDLVIRAVRPSAVLVWHQWNSLMILARAAAERRGIPTAVVHEGMLPGTMTIDGCGMMAESDAVGATIDDDADAAPFLAGARRVIDDIRTRRLDRKPQAGTPAAARILESRRRLGLRTVFYAGVNDWQSGNLPCDHPRARSHAPHYRDTLDGLAALLATAERQDFLVLFKPHPNLFPRPLDIRHDRLIHVREAAATDCILGTDATVTLLSSLAYISLAHRKPTVLLGRNTLSGVHAAHELDDYADLDACMAAALAGEGSDRRNDAFERHVAALLQRHLFPYGDQNTTALLGDDDAVARLLALGA